MSILVLTMAELPLQGGIATDLAEFISDHGDEILDRWREAVVERLPAARDLALPLLRDHMPDLLTQLARVVARGGDLEALDDLPDIHALERLDEGFDLQQVVLEYRLLRRSILELWGLFDAPANAAAQLLVLDDALDQAVTASVLRYTQARERTLRALDRIAAAALGSHDVEAFLGKLLTVLMETTAVVDAAAILLRDGDQLRVAAAVGLAHEGTLGATEAVGDGFAGQVARTGEPRVVRDAASDPALSNATFHPAGIHALYGVPLSLGRDVLGVAMIGSRTTYEYSAEDRLLFRMMANRATALLLQANLYDQERRARAEAERLLALVHTLLEASPVGVAFLDTELRYQQINQAMARLDGAGLTAEDHVGRRMREVVAGDADALEPLLRRVLATGEPVLNYELDSLRHADEAGARRTLLSSYYPIQVEGETIGVGAVVADVSERKRSEDALRESEERFRGVQEFSPDGFCLFKILRDTSGHVYDLEYTYQNQAAARFNGISQEQVKGRRLLELIPRHRVSGLWDVVQKVAETGTPERFEIPYARPEGPMQWFLVSASRVGDLLAASFSDISDRKRHEDELRRTAEFREKFIGVVSHDLRNPLSAIKFSAAAVLRNEDLPDAVLRPVLRIASSADRMARMINDLLDFTRGRLGGGIPVFPQPVNLRQLLRHLAEELQVTQPERRIQVQAEGDCHGEWDADRLSQVVINLGSNALTYGVPGTPVELVLTGEHNHVELRIKNQGAIPRELLPTLFSPFSRAIVEEGGGRSPRGLGLGLYIAQQIVIAHGGTIDVRTGEQEGTVFTVRLPRRAPRSPNEVVPMI